MHQPCLYVGFVFGRDDEIRRAVRDKIEGPSRKLNNSDLPISPVTLG